MRREETRSGGRAPIYIGPHLWSPASSGDAHSGEVDGDHAASAHTPNATDAVQATPCPTPHTSRVIDRAVCQAVCVQGRSRVLSRETGVCARRLGVHQRSVIIQLVPAYMII